MEPRISCLTLGVADVERATAFYEALGFTAQRQDDITFCQANGFVLALWSREQLAEDSCVRDGGGWGGVTLAYNTRSKDEVDAVYAQALAAGATPGREPDITFWGGYTALFLDPDGHPWEVAFNEGWPITEDGRTQLG